MFQDKAGRTEKPTPRKLHKARQEGQVPRTKELSGALSLLAFLAFAHLAGGDWLARLRGLVSGVLGGLARPELTPSEVVVVFGTVGSATAALLALPLGVVMAAGIGGNLLQGPPPLTLKPLKPDLTKLNPAKGLSKIVKLKSWIEMLKGLLKMVLFSAIAVSAVLEAFAKGLPGAPSAEGAFLALMTITAKVVLRVALLTLALSIIDYLFQRFEHTRELRMTKQEVKDEQKQVDGDPLVKTRIRSKQMALARSRMMTDVPKATVVVTNPTHFAVALRYVPGEMDVPKVLAKGRAKLAARIREIAEQHDVPIVRDPPLARALYRAVQVGGFIPQQLFRAVAEILALVFRDRSGGRAR